MDQATADLAPLLGFMLADYNDVREQAEAAQRATQAHRLLSRIADRRLDDQEIQITSRTRVASRM